MGTYILSSDACEKKYCRTLMSGQAIYIKEICLFDTKKLVWTTILLINRSEYFIHTKVSHQCLRGLVFFAQNATPEDKFLHKPSQN